MAHGSQAGGSPPPPLTPSSSSSESSAECEFKSSIVIKNPAVLAIPRTSAPSGLSYS